MEKNRNIDKNIIENKLLLSKLKNEIEKNFWINENDIQYIIRNESLTSLEKLKLDLQNKNKNFWKEEIEKLYEKLNQVKSLIEDESKNKILDLKKEVEEKINIDNFQNKIEKYLPRKLIKIAKNPEKPHEHLVWASLWIANSTIAIWESILKIWTWIIKSPYDLYLLASWKAELENVKRI